jgi:ceramide glucosyltransferase
MHALHPLTEVLGLASLTVAACYSVLALLGVLAWQLRKPAQAGTKFPPITILKPLCGAEPGLYENLRSFCQQTYPDFQIVFGVRDPSDPALLAAERLATEFPSLPMDIVVDAQQHGSNRKVSNLINMLSKARHDVIVMADSDARVEPDYLGAVTAPLLDIDVGLVTCLYQAEPTPTLWSRLGAMYVNEWYIPSVLLAWLFGHQRYVSGQTICIRRDTLEAIGGLQAIANHLADDNELGELVHAQGLQIVLSPYLLKAEHHEPSFDMLMGHELRWMRTLRALRPRAFRWIFLSFSLPLAMAGIALCAPESAAAGAWGLFQVTVLARLAVHFVYRLQGDRPPLRHFWLLPLRELLMCWVWYRSLFTSRIAWRGTEFDVDARGIMRRPS